VVFPHHHVRFARPFPHSTQTSDQQPHQVPTRTRHPKSYRAKASSTLVRATATPSSSSMQPFHSAQSLRQNPWTTRSSLSVGSHHGDGMVLRGCSAALAARNALGDAQRETQSTKRLARSVTGPRCNSRDSFWDCVSDPRIAGCIHTITNKPLQRNSIQTVARHTVGAIPSEYPIEHEASSLLFSVSFLSDCIFWNNFGSSRWTVLATR